MALQLNDSELRVDDHPVHNEGDVGKTPSRPDDGTDAPAKDKDEKTVGHKQRGVMAAVDSSVEFLGFWFGAARFDVRAQETMKANPQLKRTNTIVKKKKKPKHVIAAGADAAINATAAATQQVVHAGAAVTGQAVQAGTAITNQAVNAGAAMTTQTVNIAQQAGTAVVGAAVQAEEATVHAGQATVKEAKKQGKAAVKALTFVNKKLARLESKGSLTKVQKWEESILTRIKSHLDRDGDGNISIEEVLTSGVEGHEVQEDMMLQHYPIFILVQITLGVVIWAIFALANSDLSGVQGLDSLFKGQTGMTVHIDCKDTRGELWRWFTYQFTHAGAAHVMMNALMCLILGIPLEGFHGFFRMAGIFNIGVVSGAVCVAVSATHSNVVGMSGGCYALMGMHAADVLINYSEKKYRRVTILGLLVLAAMDFLQTMLNTGKGTTSHAAHFGGFLGGLAAGILFEKNMRVTKCERALQIVIVFAAISSLLFCFIWFMQWPPKSLWDDSAWCWVRQISNATLFGKPNYVCVRCHSEGCIRQWQQQQHQSDVSFKECDRFNVWQYKEV